MKAELHVHSSPAVGTTIVKLTFLISVVLTLGYGVVKMFASALTALF